MLKFLKNFLDSSKNKQKSTQQQSNEDEQQSNIPEVTKQIYVLTSNGQYRTALDILFPLLESKPDNKQILDLAATTVSLGINKHESVEPLTDYYLDNPLLDRIFSHCDLCGNMWVTSPMHYIMWKNARENKNSGRDIVFNADTCCSKCGIYTCSVCIRKEGVNPPCPKCGGPLSLPIEPNGRPLQRSRKRKEKLKLVVLLREGPITPDDEYITRTLQKLSPEVFIDKPQVTAFCIPIWPSTNLEMQKLFLELYEVKLGISPLDAAQQAKNIEEFYAIDYEENRLGLWKFY